MSRSKLLFAGATAALVAGLTLPTTSAAGQPSAVRGNQASDRGGADARHTGPNYNSGKQLKVSKAESEPVARGRGGHPVNVGQVRTWLALDDYLGQLYLKSYKLRGIGDNIEVWVAQDTSFPGGDCRNDLGLADITKRQVNSFISEFDSNIYPTESATFSTPPERDGTHALLRKHYGGLPRTQFQGDGDNIVVLVDNVRDANFYDPTSADGQTYIAGFFYSVFNEYTDRNIMTIDAYDWMHRTGANPPDDTTDPAYIQCANELGSTRPLGTSRPHMYEGVFAHEYQHLLEYYEDPDEMSWVNEGLSDWAQTLVGYVDPSVSPDSADADSHISCFLGYQDPSFGGPENSLTAWGDQGGPEILCDYGAAYTMMEYLHSHYGDSFMTALHREDLGGLDGLQVVLDDAGAGVSAQESLHRWAAMAALDNALDNNGGDLTGAAAAAYRATSLSAMINWDNEEAWNTPGAPPNGSDYVRLRDGSGSYLSAGDISSIDFDGAAALEAQPLEWVVDSTPPDATAGDSSCGNLPSAGSGAAALYSGCGPNLDRAAVRSVNVPAGSPMLTFDALWDTEPGWDFAYVQVSTDGGQTWQSLPTADTTTAHDPGAIPAVVDNLPGFDGDSGGWQSQTADLSAFAGQSVLLAFRYITDSGVDESGFWVRNIAVDGSGVPSDTLSGWQSASEVNPTPVEGWTVQLVAYGPDGQPAWVHQLALDGSFHGSLSGTALTDAIGDSADTVAAIVMYDDSTEGLAQEARYTLTVDGVVQPGG